MHAISETSLMKVSIEGGLTGQQGPSRAASAAAGRL